MTKREGRWCLDFIKFCAQRTLGFHIGFRKIGTLPIFPPSSFVWIHSMSTALPELVQQLPLMCIYIGNQISCNRPFPYAAQELLSCVKRDLCRCRIWIINWALTTLLKCGRLPAGWRSCRYKSKPGVVCSDNLLIRVWDSLWIHNCGLWHSPLSDRLNGRSSDDQVSDQLVQLDNSQSKAWHRYMYCS